MHFTIKNSRDIIKTSRNIYQLIWTKYNFYSTMEASGCSLQEIVKRLDEFANPKLAECWDNVGLLVEPSEPHIVSRVLLTNDLTLPVLEEAIKIQPGLIISYHPLIFAPLKHITQCSWKEKIIGSCLENRIAVYCPHTAWDATPGAVADSLASAFGDHVKFVKPITPKIEEGQQLYDVLTSKENLASISKHIVHSYNSDNNKVFVRILAHKELAEKIAAQPNTYVNSIQQLQQNSEVKIGMGRIVQFKEPGCSLNSCIEMMKKYTGLTHVRLAKGLNHDLGTTIKTVAVVPGSGGSLLKGVKADLFVTGEMFHHDLLEAMHHNTSVILTNHSDSERPFLKQFRDYLSNCFPNISVTISKADKDPITTV